MGIPDWCKTVEAGFTETLLPSLQAQVCAAMQGGGGGLVHSAPPSPPWDMAAYMWLPQGTHESCLQPAGLLLRIALPPGAEEKHGWLRAAAPVLPQLCPAQLKGHQHCFWACSKKQPSNKMTAAS